MARQAKTTKKSAPKVRKQLINFASQHKNLSIFIFISIFALAIVGTIKYVTYLNKFSDKDYAIISETVRGIFKNVGSSDTEEYKHCSYETPEKYSRAKLYCSIEIASYLNYVSDEQAIGVAKSLEKEIAKNIGPSFYGFGEFYKQPRSGHAVTTTTLKKPLPNVQCNFYIDSHENAKTPVGYLPEKTENNLLSMSFTCSGQSREEYFPVTYRQGS